MDKHCLKCGKITQNPKFCSRSCSISWNNETSNGRKLGKRSKNKKCVLCGDKITWNLVRCSKCKHLIKTNNGWKDITIVTKADLITCDTQKYRRIRNHARKIAIENNILDSCIVCGYNIYVECAHKIPIASFKDEDLIIDINSPSNLYGLCPNHHWEYDNGLLIL